MARFLFSVVCVLLYPSLITGTIVRICTIGWANSTDGVCRYQEIPPPFPEGKDLVILSFCSAQDRLAYYSLNITHAEWAPPISTSIERTQELIAPPEKYFLGPPALIVYNISCQDKDFIPYAVHPLPLGMGEETLHKLLNFTEFHAYMDHLKTTSREVNHTITYENGPIRQTVQNLLQDSHVSVWEIFFGYSPTADHVFNVLIHPIIILTFVQVLLCIVMIFMCCKLRHVYNSLQSLTYKMPSPL
ncbi:uncharacterized protein LOC115474418 [Microcaecilia unicolor]|uniref:Uncharacterized protein LOC115474418 n=1 Tax=Microcaecilia unicolor TaxID=1415580 RepID=A0A6P7YRE2_9AMPH|nr:uncharacterized protein LOC115474418 [Microcaecilia unicolor]